MPASIIPTMAMPINVPYSLPEPPNTLVPPMNTAANTSSMYRLPVWATTTPFPCTWPGKARYAAHERVYAKTGRRDVDAEPGCDVRLLARKPDGVAERVAVQEKPKGKRHYNQPERLHGQEAAKPPCQHAMHGASPQIRQPECESLAQQHDSAAPEKLRPDGRYDGRHADIRDQKAVAETDPQADQDGDDDAEPDLPRVYRRERKAESGYRQRRGETQIHPPPPRPPT